MTEPIEWKSVDRPFAPNTPEVMLEVKETDTFSDVIDRALAVLDPDAEAIPFWGTYEGGPPPKRATLVRVGPLDGVNRDSEAAYVHEDPVYGVHADGTVYRAEAHYPGPFPVVDLLRAAEDGYSDRDVLDVLVSQHHGGYGGGGDIASQWLTFLGGIGIGVATNLVTDGIKQTARSLLLRVRGLRLRRVDPIAVEAAAAWEANGFEFVPELRGLFDKKSTWTEAEVARRLNVPTSTARQLLFALGHNPQGTTGIWVRGSDPAAHRRRKHWLRQEFRRSMGPRWRQYWKSSNYEDL